MPMPYPPINGAPERLMPKPRPPPLPHPPLPKPPPNPPLGMVLLLCCGQFRANLHRCIGRDHPPGEKHTASPSNRIHHTERPDMLEEHNHRRGTGRDLLCQMLNVLRGEQA